MLLVFFFSSRRRHTRCLSDWSSDVCSSDLSDSSTGEHGSMVASIANGFAHPLFQPNASTCTEELRSEERRVGKECRSRGSPEHRKKKKKSGDRERTEHSRVHN